MKRTHVSAPFIVVTFCLINYLYQLLIFYAICTFASGPTEWDACRTTGTSCSPSRTRTDHLAIPDVAQDRSENVGHRVILPFGFQGSPRNIHQNYQDAMAIVRKYGKPDSFITFTRNPRWPDVVDHLPGGVMAFDRPDLVSRVFDLELREPMEDITRRHVFDWVEAFFENCRTPIHWQFYRNCTNGRSFKMLIVWFKPTFPRAKYGQSTTRHRKDTHGVRAMWFMNLRKSNYFNYSNYSSVFRTCNIYKNDSFVFEYTKRYRQCHPIQDIKYLCA